MLTGAGEASPQTQWLIDEEVQRIVDDAHAEVTQLLTEHRDRLDSLTHALLEGETRPTHTLPQTSRCARRS